VRYHLSHRCVGLKSKLIIGDALGEASASGEQIGAGLAGMRE
jgi:hypothetical protein